MSHCDVSASQKGLMVHARKNHQLGGKKESPNAGLAKPEQASKLLLLMIVVCFVLEKAVCLSLKERCCMQCCICAQTDTL